MKNNKINVDVPILPSNNLFLNFVFRNINENVLFDLKIHFCIMNFVNKEFSEGRTKTQAFEKLSDEEVVFCDNYGLKKSLSLGTIRNIYNNLN